MNAVEIEIEALDKFMQDNEYFIEYKQIEVEDELYEEDILKLSRMGQLSHTVSKEGSKMIDTGYVSLIERGISLRKKAKRFSRIALQPLSAKCKSLSDFF